jgi:excisionase family DNA binding protein
MEPLLVGKKDAAKFLGISQRMIDYLVQGRELSVRRVGRRVLFSYRMLQQFASGRKRGKA